MKYLCKAQEEYDGNLNQSNGSLDGIKAFDVREICGGLYRSLPCIRQLTLMQSNK